MGKGDRKSKKGKRILGSYGNTRKRKKSTPVEAATAKKTATKKAATAKKATAKKTTTKKTTTKKAASTEEE